MPQAPAGLPYRGAGDCPNLVNPVIEFVALGLGKRPAAEP